MSLSSSGLVAQSLPVCVLPLAFSSTLQLRGLARKLKAPMMCGAELRGVPVLRCTRIRVPQVSLQFSPTKGWNPFHQVPDVGIACVAAWKALCRLHVQYHDLTCVTCDFHGCNKTSMESSMFRQETYVVAFRKEGVNWLEHPAFIGAATGADIRLQPKVHGQIVSVEFVLRASHVLVLIFEAAVQSGRESRRHEWSCWHRLIQY